MSGGRYYGYGNGGCMYGSGLIPVAAPYGRGGATFAAGLGGRKNWKRAYLELARAQGVAPMRSRDVPDVLFGPRRQTKWQRFLMENELTMRDLVCAGPRSREEVKGQYAAWLAQNYGQDVADKYVASSVKRQIKAGRRQAPYR